MASLSACPPACQDSCLGLHAAPEHAAWAAQLHYYRCGPWAPPRAHSLGTSHDHLPLSVPPPPGWAGRLQAEELVREVQADGLASVLSHLDARRAAAGGAGGRAHLLVCGLEAHLKRQEQAAYLQVHRRCPCGSLEIFVLGVCSDGNGVGGVCGLRL